MKEDFMKNFTKNPLIDYSANLNSECLFLVSKREDEIISQTYCYENGNVVHKQNLQKQKYQQITKKIATTSG